MFNWNRRNTYYDVQLDVFIKHVMHTSDAYGQKIVCATVFCWVSSPTASTWGPPAGNEGDPRTRLVRGGGNRSCHGETRTRLVRGGWNQHDHGHAETRTWLVRGERNQNQGT